MVILSGSLWASICCNVWHFSCFALLEAFLCPWNLLTRKKIWINAFCFAVMQNLKLLVFLCRLFFMARCKYKTFYISPRVRQVRLFFKLIKFFNNWNCLLLLFEFYLTLCIREKNLFCHYCFVYMINCLLCEVSFCLDVLIFVRLTDEFWPVAR